MIGGGFLKLNERGLLVIISGPSGVGKGTSYHIIGYLSEEQIGYAFAYFIGIDIPLTIRGYSSHFDVLIAFEMIRRSKHAVVFHSSNN